MRSDSNSLSERNNMYRIIQSNCDVNKFENQFTTD